MANEIPDGMDETPLHPQTVEGKILEMRDIGAALLETTDHLLECVEDGLEVRHTFSGGVSIEDDPKIQAIETLIGHILKLTTLTQLQTDTITQLYGELRGPGSAW